MHDVHQTIEALGNALGLGGLAFDANGNLTLTIDDALLVNLHQVDAKTIEVWTAIQSAADPRETSVMASLLVANYLGEGSGAARLALTPDRAEIVLCERLRVEELDAAALERRLTDFIRHAMFWNTSQALPNAGTSRLASPAASEETSFMIRA